MKHFSINSVRFSGTFAILFAACSSGGGIESTSSGVVLAKVAGDGQSVIATLPVPVAPAVRAAVGGSPIAGDTVIFEIADASPVGGTITGAVQITGADGVATVGSWTPGNNGSHTLTATLRGSNPQVVTFSAASTPYQVLVTTIAGGGQFAPPGTAVPTAPRVLVKLFNPTSGFAPLAGATVTFVIGSGGGSVTGAVTTTDSNGVASVGSWTLGSAPGINTLLVIVSPLLDPIGTITATARP